MSELKFFKCNICGNFVELFKDGDMPMTCCDETMEELVPNTVEASTEKHIPVVTVDGDTVTVKVGSVEHPMVEEHHIEFIYLQTENGVQRKCLKVGAAPEGVFKLAGDKAVEAYEYCNLHGLWKYRIK